MDVKQWLSRAYRIDQQIQSKNEQIEVWESLGRHRDELINVRREIEEAINKVQNVTLRLLLEQRYLLCKGWEDIADFMGYCVEYVKRDIHKQALRAAREIIAP